MIPKIIHYCWLSGDPIPADLQKCMRTWKKILPDYEFMLWDTKKFDINSSLWVKQAFENKKYAFAADYIRLYALYYYGGIYLDMDVEVLKSYNPLLHLNMFIGKDHTLKNIEAATWGATKKLDFIKVLLDFYKTQSFIKEDGTFNIEPMPYVVMKIWEKNNYNIIPVENIEESYNINKKIPQSIPIFPREWFCPLDWYTYKLHKTKNTFSIHRYKGSWLEDKIRKERNILSKLGPYIPRIWRKIQFFIRKIHKNN